jgi:uncharacterized protein
MKLEQSFEVEAPIDRVWRALIDVERVAPCLPGASVTGRNDDGTFAGNLTIKIGPTTAAYTGRLEMEQIDESSHTATMQAQGTDKRGQGGAKATITSRLSEAGDATRVDVSTDYHITGRLARFGRGGMIEDISNRLLKEFAACLQSSLAREDGASGGVAEAAGAADAPASSPAAGAPVSSAAGDAETAATPASSPAEAAETPAPTEAAEAETVVTAGSDAQSAVSAGPATSAPSSPGTSASPSPGTSAPSSPGTSAPPPPAEPSNAIEGLPLLTSVLWERTRRNPLPVALVLGFLLALVTLRRRLR